MTRYTHRQRTLLHGPFHGSQSDRVHEILDEHIAAGARDILYVVPSGAAKRAISRELLRRRGAIFGLRLSSFAALPREVERRARVSSPDWLDPLAMELLAERAVRSACGSTFPPGVPIGSLARQAQRLMDSLERSGVTRQALAAELQGGGESDEGTRLLLEAWAEWERLRPEGHGTPADAIRRALGLLRDNPGSLAGCELIVLDNLPLQHALERELLAALVAAAPGVVVAVCAYPRQLRGTSAVRWLEAVRSMAEWEERECPPAATRFRAALDRLFALQPADSAGAELPPDLPTGAEVRLLEAAGDAGEVRLAARVIRRHLRAGVPPEQVQVVLRSPGRYLRLIEEIFACEGIPLAIARSPSLAGTDLGDVMLRLLKAAVDPEDCSREESLALLRTPHLDLAAHRADRFERRVRTQGYVGFTTWEPLEAEIRDRRTRERVRRFRTALVDAHRGLQTLHRAEDAARIARRLAQELRLLGNAYFARMRTLRQGGEDGALRALIERAIRQDNQAWEAIEKLLEEMPALLEIAGIPPGLRGLALAERWLSVLRRAFGSTSAGGEYPAAGAVRVVGTAGAQAVRITLVLGLREKVFPRAVRQDAFLRDEVRGALRERRGWHLPLAEELAEEEREHFLRAAGSASEVLYLSCAATDSQGRPALRSFFLQDLARVCPPSRTERLLLSDLAAPLHDATTAADLLATISHDTWQHLPPGPAFRRQRAVAFRAYDELVQRGLDLDPVHGARRHERRPAFDPALFEQAPHRTLRLSASQLQSLGECTYKHYVQKVLSPKALDEPAYDAPGRGSLIHEAIAEWSTRLEGWSCGAAALEEVDRWMAERIERWPPSLRRNPRALHQAAVTRQRLQEFLRAELTLAAQAGEGRAQPRHHELAFGEQPEDAGRRDPASALEAFPMHFDLQEPVTVHFRGSIDRVDVFERGGNLYGVAIDYKTGRTAKHHAEAMRKGNDLQLRLYLLALEHFWGITPVAAFYLGFGDGLRRGVVHADFAEQIPLAPEDDAKRLNEGEWHAFVHEATPALVAPLIRRLVRLDITAAPRGNDCGYCNHRPLCRFERFADELAHA